MKIECTVVGPNVEFRLKGHKEYPIFTDVLSKQAISELPYKVTILKARVGGRGILNNKHALGSKPVIVLPECLEVLRIMSGKCSAKDIATLINQPISRITSALSNAYCRKTHKELRREVARSDYGVEFIYWLDI